MKQSPYVQIVWGIVATLLLLVAGQPAMSETQQQDLTEMMQQLRPLFDAIRQVETGGEPNAGRDTVGDGGRSLGPYQISRPYFLDSGVPGEYEEVVRSLRGSEIVMIKYWARYQPEALQSLNYEVLARTHNGGPRGSTKECTLPYWSKVQKAMEEQAQDN